MWAEPRRADHKPARRALGCTPCTLAEGVALSENEEYTTRGAVMPNMSPTPLFDLLDAPSFTVVRIGDDVSHKDAPLRERPWRREGTTQGIGSQILWARWQKAQETEAG